jgi:hypothetical protein
MRIGWIFPTKQIIIVGEKSACRYRFRFGRFHSKEPLPLTLLSSQKGTLFFDTLSRDFHIDKAPKLKFLDRKSFLYQALTSHFKTAKWLSYYWLSADRYLALKINPAPIFSFSMDKVTCGMLEGELGRLKVFEKGEGLILAPSKDGKVREIYLKNHFPHFIRLMDAQGIDWDTEIDALKRYFERHYQVNPQALNMVWWGPNLPSSQKLKTYASTLFEDDLVQHSAQYFSPVLKCYPLFSPHLFSLKEGLGFLTSFFWSMSIFLVILSCCLFEEYRQSAKSLTTMQTTFVEKQKELYQAQDQLKSQLKEIDPEWNIKLVVDVYEKLLPLCVSPLHWLQKISLHVKQDCRVHEFFWGRGQVVIHPKDQTMSFNATSWESPSHTQGLVLGVTGPSIDCLQALEKTLGKSLPSVSIELWEPQELPSQGQKNIAALIHLEDKFDSHENP